MVGGPRDACFNGQVIHSSKSGAAKPGFTRNSASSGAYFLPWGFVTINGECGFVRLDDTGLWAHLLQSSKGDRANATCEMWYLDYYRNIGLEIWE